MNRVDIKAAGRFLYIEHVRDDSRVMHAQSTEAAKNKNQRFNLCSPSDGLLLPSKFQQGMNYSICDTRMLLFSCCGVKALHHKVHMKIFPP